MLPSGLAVYVGNIPNSDIVIFHKFLYSLAMFSISKTIHKVVNVNHKSHTHTHTHTHTHQTRWNQQPGVCGVGTHTLV